MRKKNKTFSREYVCHKCGKELKSIKDYKLILTPERHVYMCNECYEAHIRERNELYERIKGGWV